MISLTRPICTLGLALSLAIMVKPVVALAQSGPDIDWNGVVTSGADARISVEDPAWCNEINPCLIVTTADGQTYGGPVFDQITYGDLAGDGQTEALIPLASGGTSGWSGALLYQMGDDTPQLLWAGSVGGAGAYIDRSAHTVFGLFKVGLPPCCPTAMILDAYTLVNGALVKQSECRYTPLGDFTIVRSPCLGLGTSGSSTLAAADNQPPPDSQEPSASQGGRP